MLDEARDPEIPDVRVELRGGAVGEDREPIPNEVLSRRHSLLAPCGVDLYTLQIPSCDAKFPSCLPKAGAKDKTPMNAPQRKGKEARTTSYLLVSSYLSADLL